MTNLTSFYVEYCEYIDSDSTIIRPEPTSLTQSQSQADNAMQFIMHILSNELEFLEAFYNSNLTPVVNIEIRNSVITIVVLVSDRLAY